MEMGIKIEMEVRIGMKMEIRQKEQKSERDLKRWNRGEVWCEKKIYVGVNGKKKKRWGDGRYCFEGKRGWRSEHVGKMSFVYICFLERRGMERELGI